MILNRIFWQSYGISVQKKKKITKTNITAEVRLKHSQFKSTDDDVRLEYLNVKCFLVRMFGVQAGIQSVGFYKIKNQRAILRKRKNANLTIGYRAVLLKTKYLGEFARSFNILSLFTF